MVTDRVAIIKNRIPGLKEGSLSFIKKTTPDHPWQFFLLGNFVVSLCLFIARRIFPAPVFVQTSYGVITFMALMFSATIVFQHLYKTSRMTAFGFMAILAVIIANCSYWTGFYSPFSYMIWRAYAALFLQG